MMSTLNDNYTSENKQTDPSLIRGQIYGINIQCLTVRMLCDVQELIHIFEYMNKSISHRLQRFKCIIYLAQSNFSVLISNIYKFRVLSFISLPEWMTLDCLNKIMLNTYYKNLFRNVQSHKSETVFELSPSRQLDIIVNLRHGTEFIRTSRCSQRDHAVRLRLPIDLIC